MDRPIPSERPANSVATYGMTETFGGVVYDGLALNGVGVRIAGEQGVAGPIEIRSPTLLRCYRDGTDPTDRHGWFRTGDLGMIDPVDGRLTVHGRSDELIITGGEKVWPADVEAILGADPRIHEVAVFGVADDTWGQRVVAAIVPVDRTDPPPLDQLRGLVREELPVACAPKEVLLMDQLPRTSLGKIARASLTGGGAPERRPQSDRAPEEG